MQGVDDEMAGNAGDSGDQEQARTIQNEMLSVIRQQEQDLTIAAQFGQCLIADNSDLREKNRLLLEQLQQKIYEMEHAKLALKTKLEAAEHDYELQMVELRSDIMGLREDVRRQKLLEKEREEAHFLECQARDRENAKLSQELDQSKKENQDLKIEMKGMHEELELKRSQMQAHVQQLDALREEVQRLVDEKRDLEARLSLMQEERDLLLETLQDSRHRVEQIEEDNRRQHELICYQDNELRQLEERAADLQQRLLHLSQSQDGRSCQAGEDNDSSSAPTQSLFAELSQCAGNAQAGASSSMPLAGHRICDPEVDDFDMDDEAFLAYVQSLDRMTTSTYDFSGSNSMVQQASTSFQPPPGDTAMLGLRSEALEAYQTLRQMCADVSARLSGGGARRSGYDTPDGLAMLEMGNRLGSLRGALADLRSLLTDLVPDEATPAAKLSQIDSLRAHYVEQHAQAESKARQFAQLNQELLTNGNEGSGGEARGGPPDTDADPEAMLEWVRRERDEMRQRRNGLRADLMASQREMEALREQIEQLAQLEGAPRPQLPDFHLDGLLLPDLDAEDEEDCEFEMPPP